MSQKLIFITGSSGFIGSHVVDVSLKSGYRVRLSVRRNSQIAFLKHLFPTFVDKIEFVIIPDISQLDAFQDCLDGVDYIFHLASPMPGKGQDIQKDYVEPAVNGTESILVAASQLPQVKKVVIMSSVLSIIPMGAIQKPGVFISESSFSDLMVDTTKPFPPGQAGAGLKYQASKILAHQATLAFMRTHSPSFDLITTHPTFVLGRSLVQMSAAGIDGINAWLWSSLNSKKAQFASLCVHVRDVAEAHVKALQRDVPSGTAFLLSGPSFGWDDVVKFVKSEYEGKIDVNLIGPFSEPPVADASKAERLLGMTWRSMEEIVGDVLDQQLDFKKSSL